VYHGRCIGHYADMCLLRAAGRGNPSICLILVRSGDQGNYIFHHPSHARQRFNGFANEKTLTAGGTVAFTVVGTKGRIFRLIIKDLQGTFASHPKC